MGETGVPRVVNKPRLGFRLPAFRTRRHALRPSHSYCCPRAGGGSACAFMSSPPLCEMLSSGAEKKWRGLGGFRASSFTWPYENPSSTALVLRALKHSDALAQVPGCHVDRPSRRSSLGEFGEELRILNRTKEYVQSMCFEQDLLLGLP